jgi:hypothetical protein
VLLIGAPIALPLALYLVWFARATRAAQVAGADAPRLGDVPWPWLLAIGLLMIASIVTSFTLMGGEQRGGTYEPAHIQDGQVVPGHIAR